MHAVNDRENVHHNETHKRESKKHAWKYKAYMQIRFSVKHGSFTVVRLPLQLHRIDLKCVASRGGEGQLHSCSVTGAVSGQVSIPVKRPVENAQSISQRQRCAQGTASDRQATRSGQAVSARQTGG